jgi:hypothetical protein
MWEVDEGAEFIGNEIALPDAEKSTGKRILRISSIGAAFSVLFKSKECKRPSTRRRSASVPPGTGWKSATVECADWRSQTCGILLKN